MDQYVQSTIQYLGCCRALLILVNSFLLTTGMYTYGGNRCSTVPYNSMILQEANINMLDWEM